jgi:hypothetical protein
MPFKVNRKKKKGNKVAVENAATGEVKGYSANPRAFQKALYANSPDAATEPKGKKKNYAAWAEAIK